MVKGGGDRYYEGIFLMRMMEINGYVLCGKEGKVRVAKGGDKFPINNI